MTRNKGLNRLYQREYRSRKAKQDAHENVTNTLLWEHPDGRVLNYPPPEALSASGALLNGYSRNTWGCYSCLKHYPSEQAWLEHRSTCPDFCAHYEET